MLSCVCSGFFTFFFTIIFLCMCVKTCHVSFFVMQVEMVPHHASAFMFLAQLYCTSFLHL